MSTQSRELYGRRVITTSAEVIDDGNILEELRKALDVHMVNRGEIQYLWDYYRGKQPILRRKKKVRPEINNKIVENRANEIVSFKVGYLCGEPIQYIGRSGDEAVSRGVSQLNEMMFSENKATRDKEIVEWQTICGTAFRMVLPDTPLDEDDAPFELFTLDPLDTFVVYGNDVGSKPRFAVKCGTDGEGNDIFSVYSDKWFWRIKGDKIVGSEPHSLGMVPIFEYPANNARLGAFEIVLPLLDGINTLASNRMDGIEQFVQAFIKFINCDIDEDRFKALAEMGAIKVKSPDGKQADVDMVSSQLDQMQTQTLVDYMYQTVLTICGMPNRNGGTSTSDTGTAVLLRDGWSLAEARAKDSELMFKMAEQGPLRLVLHICRNSKSVPSDAEINGLRLKDISLKFTRRNYEAIQSKAQVLTTLLQQEKVHPKLAFEHSGLFIDPENAYALSMAYFKEQQEKQTALAEPIDERGTEEKQK